ncbi:hypothetical protein [Nitrosophilus alvini]|nr:hypothetical protein [Nitrosophilus alvini]
MRRKEFAEVIKNFSYLRNEKRKSGCSTYELVVVTRLKNSKEKKFLLSEQ